MRLVTVVAVLAAACGAGNDVPPDCSYGVADNQTVITWPCALAVRDRQLSGSCEVSSTTATCGLETLTVVGGTGPCVVKLTFADGEQSTTTIQYVDAALGNGCYSTYADPAGPIAVGVNWDGGGDAGCPCATNTGDGGGDGSSEAGDAALVDVGLE